SARWMAAAGPAREGRRVPGDAVLRRAAAAVPLWRPARPEPVPVRVRIAPAAMAPAAAPVPPPRAGVVRRLSARPVRGPAARAPARAARRQSRKPAPPAPRGSPGGPRRRRRRHAAARPAPAPGAVSTAPGLLAGWLRRLPPDLDAGIDGAAVAGVEQRRAGLRRRRGADIGDEGPVQQVAADDGQLHPRAEIVDRL